MPSESDTATHRWLSDVRYHIEMAQRFVAGLNYESFKDDLLRSML